MKRILLSITLILILSSINGYSAGLQTFKIQIPNHMVIDSHPDWATLDLKGKEFVLVLQAPWKLTENCMRNIVINMQHTKCLTYSHKFILVDRKDIESGKYKVDYKFLK